MALRVAAAAAAFAGVFLLACGGAEEMTPATFVVNDSPSNCLELIEQSWSRQDFDQFQPALSPHFVFHFNPNDVGSSAGGYVIPASWDYAHMTRAVRHLLNRTYSVDAAILTDYVGTPAAGDTTWRAEHVPIGLELMVDAENGYRADDDSNFEFERYGENNARRWRVTVWEDHSYDSRMSTLGRILAMYYL